MIQIDKVYIVIFSRFFCVNFVFRKMDKSKLYQSLRTAYSKAYPLKTYFQVQDEVVKIWNELKKNENTDKNLSDLVAQKCVDLKEKKLQLSANFFSAWKKNSQKPSNVESTSSLQIDLSSSLVVVDESVNNLSNFFEKMEVTSIVDDPKMPVDEKSVQENVTDANIKVPVVYSNPKPTPVQDRLQKEIKFLNTEIVALTERKESGLFNDDMRNELRKKRELLTTAKKKLHTLEREMIRKRTSRKCYKKKLKQICEKFPEVKKDLKVRLY